MKLLLHEIIVVRCVLLGRLWLKMTIILYVIVKYLSSLLVVVLFLRQFSTQQADPVPPGNLVFDGAIITRFGYASKGPKLERSACRGMLCCGHFCLKNPRCSSFNYEVSAVGYGLCELSDKSITSQWDRDADILEQRPGFLFVQPVRKVVHPRSCLDYLREGSHFSGYYKIYDEVGSLYQVYCDITSEPGAAWTLFMSEKTPGLGTFSGAPLFDDNSTSEEHPNWNLYRLSLAKMKFLRSLSSHWRVTCSFQLDGAVDRDYVRAKISDFDPIAFKGLRICKKVEYINVRGHQCSGCEAAWWQEDGQMLHHDSYGPNCGFDPSSGATNTEDDFGFYANFNPKFRCTEAGRESTTNHWFGSYLK